MQTLATVLRQDPLLAYSVAAALVLLAAALAAGLHRLDFVAVLHPHGLLAVVSAVFASLLLMMLVAWLERTLGRLPWLWLNLPDSAFPLVGAWRLPLYIVALAYGPSAGLTSAALIAAFSARTGVLGWQESLLAFELILVGWLAIAPNPRAHPWAGTLNILLAHLLTLITLGFAILRWQQQPLTLANLWQLPGEVSGGVLVSALVAAYVTPAFYARVFAASRLTIHSEQTPHMPLPPLTATSADPTTKDPVTAATSAHDGAQPVPVRSTAPMTATPATSTPATSIPTTSTQQTPHHPATRQDVSLAGDTDTQHDNVTHDSDTHAPVLARDVNGKRPSERKLSMPTFFEVDTFQDNIFDNDSFESGSFEVDKG